MAKDLYTRTMNRCVVPDCRRWWSVGPDGTPERCACGGELAEVDFDAHRATLSYAAHDHTKDKKPNSKP